MSILNFILMAMLVIAGSFAQAEEKSPIDDGLLELFESFRAVPYYRPGHNKCDPDGGCTLEWSIGNTIKVLRWPQNVVEALIRETQTTDPLRDSLAWGATFWMVGGGSLQPDGKRSEPVFIPRMVATWMVDDADGKSVPNKGHTEPYDHWFVKTLNGEVVSRHAEDYDYVWHLGKVDACGNWMGWRDGIRIRIRVPQDGDIPITVNASVSCTP